MTRWLFLSGILCLTACKSATIEDSVEDYQQRLYNVIDQVVVAHRLQINTEQTLYTSVEYPRVVAHVDNTQTISLVELQKLQFCDAGLLLAERNSQLGKLALPSQRFKYHIQLFAALFRCKTSTDDPSTQALIDQLLTHSQQHYQHQWQTFISNSDALRKSFSQGKSEIAVSDHVSLQAQQHALSWLSQFAPEQIDLHGVNATEKAISIKVAQWDTAIGDIETHLYNVEQQNLKDVINALQRSTQQIRALNDHLITLSDALACQPKSSNKHIEYLQNIFDNYYVKQVQPAISVVLMQYQKLQPTLAAVYQQYPQFAAYYTSDTANSLSGALKTEFRRHALWWKQLRQSCQATDNTPEMIKASSIRTK